MKTPNETQLAEALSLAKERTKIVKELEKLQTRADEIGAKIHKILGTTPTDAAAPAPTPAPEKRPTTKPVPAAKEAKKPAPKEVGEKKPAPTTPKAKTVKAEKPKAEKKPVSAEGKKPKLGAEILRILTERPDGVSVEELAKLTGREMTHIYVWRSNIGSKIPGLRLASPGVIAYTPPSGSPELPLAEEK